MRLKVAILDQDKVFMKRFAEAFRRKYSNEIGLTLFSDESTLRENLKEICPDVVLCDETVKMYVQEISESFVCGYLSRKPGVGEIDGLPAVFRYQNIDKIYKEIQDIYAGRTMGNEVDKDIRIVVFTSAQGGCGTSAAAAAYALRSAVNQKRVCYLNLERFGNPELYFCGEGGQEVPDMELLIQHDSSGVDFINGDKNENVLSELGVKELKLLFEDIFRIEKYDEIVIDLPGNMDKRMSGLISRWAGRIVYVTDGSLSGRDKFGRFCEAVKNFEQQNGCDITEKMVLMYNCFIPTDCEQIVSPSVTVLGGITRYKGLSGRALAERISQVEFFGKI